ncbi:peptidoglycan/xylan/chitin deacetylase (PgdA/CDA1 family) [Actinoplanes lutulentus]|uniref:Beta-1,4-N-acetylglucosamine oligosaccharide deacetylase NodB n=1 Tax=Actinoplanes lutulentus TaxID=1287878 RepID=A0A327Z8E3_9ACTN|nr:polysaccharide deacetylase family protein [Actinoplanes lutulentus]MBB2947843.1 peptidoglycan/xylan/chitin deacetylase (PgdA/CDA1 family) [Actinoplanes lutulentus]RAK29844.1 beta-1,4-N-acetylglucosamine oligosaccharide deacetylase NodB [Actinoplanes lutulentus]
MTTGSKAIALTFDDGPDPDTTPQLLKLLAKYDVHATFCVIGTNVADHPALIRQIVAGGHSLCNHSWHHDEHLGKLPADKIKKDLKRTNDAIHKAAPDAKIGYFRAPAGNFTTPMVRIAADLGMTSIYWRVDPRDWSHPAGETDAQHVQRVVKAVQKQTRKGSIILSHDGGQPDSIIAYRELLPWLDHRFTLTGKPQ